jgi:hypothetical protein
MKLSISTIVSTLKGSFAPRGQSVTPDDIFAAAEAGRVHTVMTHFDTDFTGMGATSSNARLLQIAAENSHYAAVARMLDYNARTPEPTFDDGFDRFAAMCDMDPVLMGLKLSYERMAEDGYTPEQPQTNGTAWNPLI